MGAFNMSKGRQQSQSGLRGTPYEGQTFTQAYNTAGNLRDVSRQIYRQPFNAAGQTQYMGFTGADILPSGLYGMGSNADMAMNQLGRQMFGYASADAAQRGQLSPENQAGVVGSAITKALPQVLPQIQNWQLAQYRAPMEVGQQGLTAAQSAADLYARLTGASASGSQNAWGFKLDNPMAPIPV